MGTHSYIFWGQTAMPDLPVTDAIISRIAREIARNLYPPATIRENYKLSQEEFDEILSTPFFKTRLEEECDIWNASDATSITKRIAAKAATLVEECLIEVYSLVHDKTQPMAAKIEALKWASRMAGIEQNPNVKAGGELDNRVKITINIGNDRVSFDKERALPPKVIEGDVIELTENV